MPAHRLQRLAFGLLGVGLVLLDHCRAQRADAPLEAFLPNEASIAQMKGTLAQLESEVFSEREAASRQLAMLPCLPAFIRELAAIETRPESAYRLKRLCAAVPIKQETKQLNLILESLSNGSPKGQIEPLCRVMHSGIWSPDPLTLYDAARATATRADLPLLERNIKDPSVILHRIAAAALGGLPAADSKPLLAGLLDDADAATTALAVTALAAQRDPSFLPAFARLLDSPDFEVRHQCHIALLCLTQQDFGYDPDADVAVRQAGAAKWRQWTASKDAAMVLAAPINQPIALFNGRNLQGWEHRLGTSLQEKSEAWAVKDGELLCAGIPITNPGDLWTIAAYENYILNLEYLATSATCDGGVGMLLTQAGERGPHAPIFLEVKLLPGNGGDLYEVGGSEVEARGKPIDGQCLRSADVKDLANAWHRLKLTVRDGTLTVAIDGVTVNRTSKGPRGPGRIVLRNEGCPMAFRNITLLR